MLTQTSRAAITMDHLNFIAQSDNYPFKFFQSVAYLQYRTTSVRHEYQSGIPELWIMKHNRGGGLPPKQWPRSSATFQSASSSRKTVICSDSIIRAKHCLPQSKRPSIILWMPARKPELFPRSGSTLNLPPQTVSRLECRTTGRVS